jgi:hypothetical protein
MPIQFYAPGAQFFVSYVLPGYRGQARLAAPPRNRADLGDQITADVLRAAPGLRGLFGYAVGEVDYVFDRGGQTYLGQAECVTLDAQAGGPGSVENWSVERLLGFEAPADRYFEAAAGLGHLAESFQFSASWAFGQERTSLGNSGIITAEGHAISNTIKRHSGADEPPKIG